MQVVVDYIITFRLATSDIGEQGRRQERFDVVESYE